jgi:hypothetical protein
MYGARASSIDSPRAMPIVNMSSRRALQEATARRAAKRQRSVEEQKKIDSEQEASRKAAEAAGGGEDEWTSHFQLLLQYKGEQGRKWCGQPAAHI